MSAVRLSYRRGGPPGAPMVGGNCADEPEERFRRLSSDNAMVARVREAVAAGGHHRGSSRRGHDRAEEPRLCRYRGHPGSERSVCCGGRRDHLRAVLHVTSNLHRSELGLGDRRWGCGDRDKCHRRRSGTTRGGDHAGDRHPLAAPGAVPDGMDRPVPLEGRRHRVPGRGRDRRRRRRAAEADRHLWRGRQRLAGVRVMDRRPRAPSTSRRWW